MKYLFGYAIGFFFSAFLVYLGAQLLKSVWVILLIVAVLAAAGIAIYNYRKNHPKW